jgi:hypothetical protein
MTREESKLAEIVARIIDIRRAQDRINPTWIASEALKEIDPGGRSVELVRIGCHLQLRQIARAQCRKLFDDDDADAADAPRFAEFTGLQWRYPTARSHDRAEPEYVLRDLMSRDDLTFNVARLRCEARSKLAHADALEAWGESREMTADAPAPGEVES